jgi:glycosyltransferase involved in cell wall biosynthesis
MHIAVVIPCLNEARLIATTAKSLGFGQGRARTPSETSLILVDNGSEDGTPAVLTRIRDASRPGSVLLVGESERGYVPARHSGVRAARDLTETAGHSPNEVLILQADADTIYRDGYVEAMRAAAIDAGPNMLIEGTTRPPSQFVRKHPGYQRLDAAIEAAVKPLYVTDEADIIVDDKVAGFWLATYFAWGSHRREYNSRGAELHAETARLFIRGKLRGGAKVRAANAVATPSRRKIIQNPIRHFANGGFPREESWWRAWHTNYTGPLDLAAFEDEGKYIALAPAIVSRKAHLAALFGILPTVIERTLRGPAGNGSLHPFVQAMANTFPPSDAGELDNNLAPLFEHAFRLINEHARSFANL